MDCDEADMPCGAGAAQSTAVSEHPGCRFKVCINPAVTEGLAPDELEALRELLQVAVGPVVVGVEEARVDREVGWDLGDLGG